MIKFNKEIKNQWVAALRSGDYKKGKELLYDPSAHSFCVLGVLGDLNNLLDGEGAYRNPKDNTIEHCGILMGFFDQRLQHELHILNDEWKLTFKELADIIDFGVTSNGKMNTQFVQVVNDVIYNRMVMNCELAA